MAQAAAAAKPPVVSAAKPAAPPVAKTGVTSPILTPSATAATVVTPAKPTGPAFQIRRVSVDQRYIKTLVYGGYGAGKTRLVGSACLVPQMRDVLMVDCESGELTLATIDDKAWGTSVADHIDSVQVKTFKQLARVQEFLKAHCTFRDQNTPEADEKLKNLEKILMGEEFDPDSPPRRYYTVIVDSLSEAETYSMYQLLGITGTSRIDEEMMDQGWPEFRRNQTQILRMVRAFRDLPMNVLMTSASDYTQDQTKRMVNKPALTGKLAKQVQGFMDIVGYIGILPTNSVDGTEVRRMMVKPSASWDAKCRFSNFKEAFWDNPTMHSILQSVGLLDAVSKK